MSKYTLRYKLLKFEQEILDEDKNIIGYSKLYWRHIGQHLARFIDRTSVLNVNIENERRELVLQLKATSRFLVLKKTWTGIIYGQPDVCFDLTLIPKMKIGFFMELQLNDNLIFIRDRTMGTEPHFLDSDNNVLAKCRDNFAGKVTLDIIDPDLNVYLVAAIAYLIRQW